MSKIMAEGAFSGGSRAHEREGYKQRGERNSSGVDVQRREGVTCRGGNATAKVDSRVAVGQGKVIKVQKGHWTGARSRCER